ncbi:hypothetical protein [Ochrobactrum sp. S1502_03]|uniref:hypothetical protein n=1 Tax=Ochrobactrum sp. S1502_03 TaxID=3108451 RepID=UPI0037C53156
MKRPVAFKQADVTRAIKGAIAAGLKVTRAEVDQTGKIIVLASEEKPTPANSLDKWLVENAN